MYKWLRYLFLSLLLLSYSSVSAGPFYEKGEELGKGLAEGAWQAVARDCGNAEGLKNFLKKRMKGVEATLLKIKASTPSDYENYGSGFISGLVNVLGKVASRCEKQCGAIGEGAGELAAYTFCAISKQIGRTAKISGLDEIPNAICGEAYGKGCRDTFKDNAKKMCRRFAKRGATFTNSGENSCSYNPSRGEGKLSLIDGGKNRGSVIVMRLNAMKVALMCQVFGDEAKGPLSIFNSGNVPQVDNDYSFCIAYSKIGKSSSIAHLTKKKIQEALNETVKSIEQELVDKQCSVPTPKERAICLREQFAEEAKKVLAGKFEGDIMSIFYTHEVAVSLNYSSTQVTDILTTRSRDSNKDSSSVDVTEKLKTLLKTGSSQSEGYTLCCFDFDSDKLHSRMNVIQSDSFMGLDTLVNKLENEVKGKQDDLLVIGYADDRGGDLYNLELGWRRAKHVVDFLCKMKLDVCDGKEEHVIITSCGESVPFDNQSSKDIQNEKKDGMRRVQIFYPAAAGVGGMSCIPRIEQAE